MRFADVLSFADTKDSAITRPFSKGSPMVFDVNVVMKVTGPIIGGAPMQYYDAALSHNIDPNRLTFADPGWNKLNAVIDPASGNKVGKSFFLANKGDDQNSAKFGLLDGLGGAGRYLYERDDSYRGNVDSAVQDAITNGRPVDVTDLMLKSRHLGVYVGAELAKTDPRSVQAIDGFKNNPLASTHYGFNMTADQYSAMVTSNFINNKFFDMDGPGFGLLPRSDRFLKKVDKYNEVAEIGFTALGILADVLPQRPPIAARPTTPINGRISDPLVSERNFFSKLVNGSGTLDGAAIGNALGSKIPGSWSKFDENLNQAFVNRLEKFGTQNLEPDSKLRGGEGQLFLSPKTPDLALKRWYQNRLGDLDRSVNILQDAGAVVNNHPVLSKTLKVVKVHEVGPDWILRDFSPDSMPLKDALGDQDVANALKTTREELQKIEDPALADLAKRLGRNPPSSNFHWSPVQHKIIWIDGL